MKPVRAQLLEQENEEVTLGEFEVEGTTLIISDPSYPIYMENGWGSGVKVEEVKPGSYQSGVSIFRRKFLNLDYGQRGEKEFERKDNMVLYAIHTDYLDHNLKWSFLADIPVDSGQVGIYDINYYDSENEEWYDQNTALTLGSHQAGVLDHGVVSSSGEGDGEYKAYVAYYRKKVVGVYVDFSDS